MGAPRPRRAIQTLFVLLLVVAASAVGPAAVGGTLSGTATPAQATGNTSTLTVLAYNDVQTAASDPGAMGRLVGTVNDRRAAHDNPVVVVGGGDQVSPSSLSPISQWRMPVDVLNVLGPDAEVVGNHDLDYGFGPVANFSATSEFPWLLANVVTADGETVPGTRNYTIVERDGVRVGVVGLVDEQIRPKTTVDFEEHGYRVADYSAVGERIARDLKTEHDVDVVIAAAHIGVPDSKELARETDHVDVVVTGDDEIVYEPQTTAGTTIVEAEARGNYVGEVDLTVSDAGVSLADGRLVSVGEDAPVNETARQVVADARERQLDRIVGQTTVPLDSTFAANYHDETAWGNLVTDAFRERTGADVAVTNSGGIRGDFVIEPGNVTYDDVYTSLPFGNHLVTKELTGEQLRQLLASQVVTLDSEEGQQYGAEPSLQVSGVSYEYVPHGTADSVVSDVTVDGEPLDSEATYDVTVNSYMAGWSFENRYGWSFEDRPTVDRDYTLYGTAVADYIAANSPVSPSDADRIRRVDRRAGTVDADVRGHGPASTVTVRTDIPAEVTDLNASTVRLQDGTNGTVQAAYADVVCGHLIAAFDGEAVAELDTGNGPLDLYAGYSDAEYDDLVYFDHSVLNMDVSVEDGDLATTLGKHPWDSPDADGAPWNKSGNSPWNASGDSPWDRSDEDQDSPWGVDDSLDGGDGRDRHPGRTGKSKSPWAGGAP